MEKPKLSKHFESRKPSAIRMAQIEFMKREDNVEALNTAIGNVSLPIHHAIQKRLFNLHSENSPFYDGVVKYTPSVGTEEANKAFLHIISSSGFNTDNLYSMITDGGSQVMELVLLAVCGPAGSSEHPILLIDPAYTNYNAFASRLGRKTVSVRRNLQDNGKFTLPDIKEIEKTIEKYKPRALVVIPYDNPTGHFYDHKTMLTLGKLCVKHNLWMISDEAYREFHYSDCNASSIWGLTEDVIPGIEGRRISIETASKVWNGCGLRIGALITDNKDFHDKSLAEYTANLCANAIGQYVFGALAHVSHDDLNKWYIKQREYYKPMMSALRTNLKEKLPGIIVSSPDAALYSVIDMRNIAKPGFKSLDFVLYCARKGKVDIDGEQFTLLVAPMSGFYSIKEGEKNPGDTQMRIAFIERPEKMILIPHLLKSLFLDFEQNR
jgi:aspartate aminotransferase